MTKKCLISLLCTAFLIASGCGSAGPFSDEKNASADTAETESVSTDSASQDDSVADYEETKLENSSVASSSLYSVLPFRQIREYTDEDENVLLYADTSTFQVQGEAYPALVKSVLQYQSQKQSEFDSTTAEYLDIAKEFIGYAKESSSDMDYFYGFSYSNEYSLKRLDSHVLSIIDSSYEYLGGAHPSHFIEGINFDAATGNILTLEDVVTDYDSFSEAAITYIQDYLAGSSYAEGLYSGYEELIRDTFSDISWYFSASGITLVYNPYAIAPYAAGTIEVPLSDKLLSAYLKEEYRLTEEPGITSLSIGESIPLTFGGENAVLMVEDNYNAVYDTGRITVSLGDASFSMEPYFSWVSSCYIIRQDDRVLLLLDGDMASDDYVTVALDLTDGTIRELAATDASIRMPGVMTAELSVRTDTLGTYSYHTSYDLSAGNELVPLESEYELITYQNLTTIADLPAANGNGEAVTIPSGASLKPVATDGNTYIRLEDTETGEEYTVSFTREDYMIMIDGRSEYDYFEMLPYAG